MKSSLSNLEIVGQFGASGVTGVHRDEDSAGRDERDLCPLEHKPLCLKTHTIIFKIIYKTNYSCVE